LASLGRNGHCCSLGLCGMPRWSQPDIKRYNRPHPSAFSFTLPLSLFLSSLLQHSSNLAPLTPPPRQIVLPDSQVRTLCQHLDLIPELPSCPHCLLRLDEPLQDLLLAQARERLPSRPDSSMAWPASVAAGAGAVAAGASSDGASFKWPNIWDGVACAVCDVMRQGIVGQSARVKAPYVWHGDGQRQCGCLRQNKRRSSCLRSVAPPGPRV
jgi:hypothetical protein